MALLYKNFKTLLLQAKAHVLPLREWGFTLIELMAVFAIFGILSSVSIWSYTSSNNSQVYESAASDFTNLLQTAKSRALSQVKPSGCTGTLDGYQVFITLPNTYEIDMVCGGVSTTISQKPLPTGMSFDSTSTGAVVFNTGTGTAVGGKFILNGFGNTRTIYVYDNGDITTQYLAYVTPQPPLTPYPTITPIPTGNSPLPTNTPTPIPNITPSATPTPPPSYLISGDVFIDYEQNHVKNGYDQNYVTYGYSTFSYTGPASGSVSTTNGSYRIDDLPAGTYTVEYTSLPAGYKKVWPTNSPPSYTVKVGPGCDTYGAPGAACFLDAIKNLSFAILPNPPTPTPTPPPSYLISGNVFIDYDQNKVKNGSDLNYANGSSTFSYTGPVSGSVSTTDGSYVIYNLPAGTYTVTYISLPAGYQMVSPLNNPPSFTMTVGPSCNVSGIPGASCGYGVAPIDVNFAILPIPPPNLIANTGCETDTSGWGTSNNASLTRSTTDRHSGVASCRVTLTGGGTSYSLDDVPDSVINPQAGKQYQATAWVHTNNSYGKDIYMAFNMYGGSHPTNAVYAIPVVLTDSSWQQITNTVTIDYNDRTSLSTFVVEDPNGTQGSPTGAFQVDDITLQLLN